MKSYAIEGWRICQMNAAVTFYRRLLRFMILPLLLLTLLSVMTVWAAPSPSPSNQTVPGPTLTSPNTPIPTATSPRGNDDDDNDDNNPPPPTATATPAGLRATVAVVRLNVRQGPGTSYSVAGVVTNGQTLQVLARNEGGDWWQICCVNGGNGWVAAQFMQSNFDQTLIPVAADIPEAPTPTAIPPQDPNALPVDTSSLAFTLQQDPLYTWQGEEVTLVYQISNPTITDTVNIELRNELPSQLHFVAIEATDGGSVITETTELSTTVFAITWPTLAAGTEVTARVRVQIDDALPDGSVIDNLAVIIADNLAAITNGISIGMPPTTLPEFR
jgi:hypothetical protein